MKNESKFYERVLIVVTPNYKDYNYKYEPRGEYCNAGIDIDTFFLLASQHYYYCEDIVFSSCSCPFLILVNLFLEFILQ